jgi:hypothetical protein
MPRLYLAAASDNVILFTVFPNVSTVSNLKTPSELYENDILHKA